MTASAWTRGSLSHDYDVDLSSVAWCTGGLKQPGRVERQSPALPARIHMEPLPTDRSLADALVDGEIDALMAPRVPAVFRNREDVGRLSPDYRARERDYFERTGLFPIMHMVVIRRDVFDADPWVAQSLHKALAEAKRVATDGLTDLPALRYTMRSQWSVRGVLARCAVRRHR